ncbi:phosphotransferase enzyme family protein [Halobacteriovorax sp. BALOs_7]|uniref:phosphotransferase n=1 Tax=Halobacteriovorax sp. BALOs_7 TaxID=2109558 RepID=UPI000EB62429|nr:phosphotransferase [Halobacteriovorax sp. BALOs_7]AYF45973.1 phosphotransferase enzyme family protein [Halobacteriovorax sp. BALOs_7]
MEINEVKSILDQQGYSQESWNLIKLSGDASSREYYRLKNESESLIVCTEEPNGQQSRDFNLITTLIEKDINTPKIYLYLPEISLLILEDVGDISLKDYYLKNGLTKHIQAVNDIKSYQRLPLETCQSRYFDREKIGFEFDLALQFFLEKHLKLNLNEDEKIVVASVRELLINYYEENKKVVCHRDYHSNNLYVKTDELYHIDYQDMRVGPVMYDLVSLVDDCYIQFSNEERSILLNSFDSEFNSKYLKDYQVVQIQRTFKALGSFAYLSIDKNKNGYLPFIKPNLKKLIDVLKLRDEDSFVRFGKILERGSDD